MISRTKDILESVASWPEEDQEQLAEVAREIEARRKSGYNATPEELAGIDRGLEDARQGRFATDEEVAAVRAKFRRV